MDCKDNKKLPNKVTSIVFYTKAKIEMIYCNLIAKY